MIKTSKIFKYLAIIYLFMAIGCASYDRPKKQVAKFGGYKTSYFKDHQIPQDSMAIRIELYMYDDKTPVDFDGARPWLLGKRYPIKKMEGNTGVAIFGKDEIPKRIGVDLYRKNFFPIYLSVPKIKNDQHILYRLYLVKDTISGIL